MPWQRHSDYAITDGRHWIAKLLSQGEPGYLLWLDGKLVHRCFDSSKAAREYAAAHEVREPDAL